MSEKRVLFVASLERHLKHFHVPYIRYLTSIGYAVDTAAAGRNAIAEVARHYPIHFSRSPIGPGNILAYFALNRVIEGGDYTMIHCHTPVASALTRLAARNARERGTAVVYTAHGFHFYSGNSPVKNFVFRHVEKWLSRYTDCIVTINQEDYEALTRYDFSCKSRILTHGVGIDPSRFHPLERDDAINLREELKISPNAFVIIYPAEYSKRKNQIVLLHALAMLRNTGAEVELLLPGDGPMRGKIMRLIRDLGLQECVKITGVRSDVPQLMGISDLSVAPSRQEGLPTHVLEAMATGLPCVASRIRGHVDLVEDGVNGFLYDVNSSHELASRIMSLIDNPSLRNRMGENSLKKAKTYFLENTITEMADLYQNLGVKEDVCVPM